MKISAEELKQAFEVENRETIRRNFTVASIVGMVLVPLFTFLDRGAVPDQYVMPFLALRLACSATIAVFLAVMLSRHGIKYYRLLGIILLLLPSSTIAFMIYRVGGAESHYYQGLNLVLLVLGFILRWNFLESLIAVSLVFAQFFIACRLNGHWQFEGENLNSYFFLGGTGIIVVVGNFWFTRLRFNEFRARFELKFYQAELVNREKEKARDEALNQVSAGILHDVGNLMAPVANYVYKLKTTASALPEDRRQGYLETLTKLERPLNVARGVLGSIQRYAHSGPQMTEECSLHSLTEDALNLVRGKTEEQGVEITTDVDRALTALGHPLDITLVIKNLLDNSLHALKEKSFPTDRPMISIVGRVEAGIGRLVLRDNGTGIPADTMPKIFEPYFTTKTTAQGTGLGLANCRRIMQSLGGSISVRSEPGEFTEFTLVFPHVNPSPSTPTPAQP